LIKYIKSVLWRVAKRLSYIEEARCLKVNWECMVPLRLPVTGFVYLVAEAVVAMATTTTTVITNLVS